MSVPRFPLIDPATLTRDQASGKRCVSCSKVLSHDPVPVGRVPDGGAVFSCGECDVALERVA